MPNIHEELKQEELLSTDNLYGNKVILYNDDYNTFDHVELCLMKICMKSEKEAQRIALEAHNKGRAICYEGSHEVCETVAEKMSLQNLSVTIE
ncbi:MAG: ATP-dependent Clp protease adaptor ClpS [Leptospiraceae bacterium]|nr:ATP-dependent Clp protease adaptor ClpS [Leptospiraceae bacterium]